MAKLSANGCHEVAKATFKVGNSHYVFALRSDGKVLSRLAGFYNDYGQYTAHATGYSIYGKIKLSDGKSTYDRTDFERVKNTLVKRGYEVLS